MDVNERETFAKDWLRGWNERDLEKMDLTQYFKTALESVPGKIELELLNVFHGVDTLIVHFQSRARKCAEFMELDRDGKIRRAKAHFQS